MIAYPFHRFFGLLGVAIFDDSGFGLAELEGIATSNTTVGAAGGVTQHVGEPILMVMIVDLGVEPKIGDFPPKWMVKIMENPIF